MYFNKVPIFYIALRIEKVFFSFKSERHPLQIITFQEPH